METTIGKPSNRNQKIAQEAVDKIRTLQKSSKGRSNAKMGIVLSGNSTQIELPAGAVKLLKEILNCMALGKAITLIPFDAELSTQQAADMLGASRPYVVKLLEEGKIPYRKIGTHRRIAAEDLMNYERDLKKARAERLAFLSKQAQQLKLGY